MLLAVQRLLPWRWAVWVAKRLSLIGEHSAAWLALSALALILDEAHRPAWFAVLLGTAAAHIGAKFRFGACKFVGTCIDLQAW